MKRCEISGHGNNPWPANTKEDAVCCDDCNCTRVIPARTERLVRMLKK